MDDIEDFFNFSKPFERIEISGGTVNGRVVPTSDGVHVKREIGLGTEYCKEYQEAEADLMLKVIEFFNHTKTQIQLFFSSADV